ncbi:MAG TPA: ATP-binding protein [Anaerolineae bacterium]|nr:ATP-binding protein [Anaerolineae bacterium]
MKLKKVEFIKYKSISEGVLDIENEITCLVGINESGKSNILFALEKADINEELTAAEYSRHSDDYGYDENSPELKLWFEPTENEKEEIQKILGQDNILTVMLTKINNNYRLDYPNIDYEKSSFAIEESVEEFKEEAEPENPESPA